MHISEGVLSGPVLLSGAALAVVGTGIGLKRLDYDRIARAGMLSACFFVASLIHVPVGPSSAHLVLNGIVGLILGWGAFPAILVALILQAAFFQFGGLTTLGVNTVIMALPAVIGYIALRPLIRKGGKWSIAAGFACGFLAVLLSALLVAAALIFTREDFFAVSWMLIAANFPVMVIEGIVTAFCATFFLKVKPELLT
ncbi:MAG: cobalamin biosynthesis protein CbiM [Deltaproteobacteria bacterium CG_4_8_14_3_um_filter_51_11]|nr:cobalt transporter CbiM [bacterium]OIP40548.1 MAG: cobalamin biosynthesis protein CbiM [Desulfobacteraceae bacterium CG2_30_51_40]PIP46319.1 MAG: cobalamin biosynthesis protein CbiM [Deltaproteobacteria bacterium CG23_combo_of_CG06-09_8_20_14_all_51_20]PIX20926.1 MAG: cobalamin biosynthesis protein CbiM [Deltaproteobacteria bacterium CG_4_8_14_3_um_filter_51_11]PIY22175.1 MAG: cobalamin biosynthesis protein CbiM [Deltaproteobacteria bacterium CG_4_10_14_3_um_filter_51_14]PJB36846.1 MAG: cob